MNPGRRSFARPLSFPILGKPITHVGLFPVTMNQRTSLLRSMTACMPVSSVGFRFFLRSSRFRSIEGQSLLWGRGFSSFIKGWELAFASSNIDYQVVKVQDFATRPPCHHGLA